LRSFSPESYTEFGTFIWVFSRLRSSNFFLQASASDNLKTYIFFSAGIPFASWKERMGSGEGNLTPYPLT